MTLIAEKSRTTIRAVPLSPSIGADIVGVDLSQPLSDDDFNTIFDAWMTHLVLRFQGQKLTKDQLMAFTTRFGEPDKAPINIKGEPWIPGYPNMTVMSNIIEQGQPMGSLGYGEA